MASRWSPLAAVALLVCLPLALADSRVDELRALRRGAKDGVIRVTDDLFAQFIRTREARPYGLFLFFDAAKLHDNHELKLPKLRREFALLAKAYASKFLAGGEAPREEVFFCDVEYGQSEKVFHSLAVNGLPAARFFPWGTKSTRGQDVDFQSVPPSADGFAQFLKAAAAVDVGPIDRPPKVSSTQILVIGGLAIVAAPFILRLLVTTRTPLHEPASWCVLGVAIYFFSVSGGMFNIIRGMPLFVPNHQHPGKFTYFYSGSGAQFGAEGFAVGALYTVVGLLVAFVTHAAPRIRSGWAQRALVFVAMGVAAGSVRQVVLLDHGKQGYWMHGFWPKWL
ncbi:hypothetical protein CLOM_g15968 [Closterium sp. NIES-68]|nr:hypothetical protein CLOM_g6676 [Closterium sp. NIES-68]GJP56911.1 hypothetical protein CLOM_g15968 [Closterium sp. NIES-68]GJP63051.1 hypothetical protein CLOP_g20127 [Closterium sp. NIES-67]